MDFGSRQAVGSSVDPLGETFPPLTANEAAIESNRCLYCYDAPCTQACPTHIDIPRFIKKISTQNLLGSARTILESNLLGATCARVCPVQELCEGACVLGSEHKPIAIGRLQRYATDYAAGLKTDMFHSGTPTGKTIAVVGAGPAGLSCAGELAKLGHSVTVYEKRDLPGGLSTYGIISLREPKEIAIDEAEMIKRLGVRFEYRRALGFDLALSELQAKYDAVFLGVGLGATPLLGIPGEELIVDGLAYIEQSKLAPDQMKPAKHVAVIGAGNTAIDCATIAKRLGAKTVTIIYRRTEQDMSAYPHEYEFIKNEGVGYLFESVPIRVVAVKSFITGLECHKIGPTSDDFWSKSFRVAERLSPLLDVNTETPMNNPLPGSNFIHRADQIIKAIGQEKPSLAQLLGLPISNGLISVDDDFETGTKNLFAGGDAIRCSGSASTVMAVQDGKLAALAIHRRLNG